MPGVRSATDARLIAPSQSGVMATKSLERRLEPGTVVHHTQADWDQLAIGLGAPPFQSWAWGELKRRFGWQPIRLSSADGRSAAQLLIRPLHGLSVAYVPRGPVSGEGKAPDSGLIDSLITTARSQRAAFLRLEPDILEDDPAAEPTTLALRSAGFRTFDRTLQPRSSIRMDVAAVEQEQLRAVSKGHRSSLRRAERDGVTVRVATDSTAIDQLVAMIVATQRRKKFVVHSPGYYRAMWQAFGDDARLFLAEYDGQVVSASLCLAYGRHGTYLVAGSSPVGLERNAAHLLQWHAIRWARERGVETWDLWGLADARGRYELAIGRGADAGSPKMQNLEAEARRDPLDGVYRFKKGWGGRVTRTLPAFDRVFIRPAYWYWQWRRGQA